MNIFEEATKLGNRRYNREKLLAITRELIARFRLPCAQEKTKRCRAHSVSHVEAMLPAV
jgi:hypothetical protein